MKNKLIIAITLMTAMGLNTTNISANSDRASQNTTQNKRMVERKINTHQSKIKKPEYYRPGHSDGLQNYPGKTIDAGMNTRMLPTNSASHMGNDISF